MAAINAATDPNAFTSTRRRLRRLVAAIAVAAMAGIASHGAADAAGASLGMTQSDLQRFGKQLGLSNQQMPKVTSITLSLVRSNSAILAKYGVNPNRCSDLGPFKLSAMNNETMAVYSRARAQLQQILNAEQMRAYSAIYNQRRMEAKARIVCGPRQAQR